MCNTIIWISAWLVMLTMANGASPRDSPDNDYNGAEQPPYTVIQKYEDFESRSYPAVSWACTEDTVAAEDSTLGEEMFFKLLGYISGDNEDNQTMDMTVPISYRMVETADQSGVYNQRMCFYIPSAFQENPPRPSDQDVQVVMIGYEEVVVQTFGGYVVNNSKWIQHAQEFREEIESLGFEEYDLSYFTYSSYDAPIHVRHRRNEVMFQKL